MFDLKSAFKCLIIISPVVTAGCLNTLMAKVDNYFDTTQLSGGEDSRIEILPIHIPAEGDRATIIDPKTNENKSVIFGKVYTAASGRKCTFYYETEEIKEIEGLTCSDNQGRWTSIEME